MIQQMPFADPAIAETINQNLHHTPNVSDLMDMGMSLPDILGKFVLRGVDYHVTNDTEVRYHCNCSKDRFARALMLLERAELEEMREGITPLCHYCSKSYHYLWEIADIISIEVLNEACCKHDPYDVVPALSAGGSRLMIYGS